ncbi:nucleobase:cation symporter-2 family protein [Pseudomonas oryzihabitans]|uniref:uracil-xanthine permease family protein n=1 Tax=Pseudomonas oryzihabitans TaxID=47885 RepID=UPI0025555FB1|nr:nucleobase:cation symporter-2 family protein [Pseudomonas oryzihabitans]MDK8263688.1 nucleobase:cation symporter-2 family protein [Pseudomonas oryzihabitans]
MPSPVHDDLLYGLDERPAPLAAFCAALQHVLASFVGIVTPPLIIAGALGLHEHLPYLISMGLMVSGVGTFLQARGAGGLGAGMICLQGTSFSFLSAVLAAGMLVKQRGGTPEDILAMIFGVCFFGAFVQIGLSRCLGLLRRVITPLVTGIVITLIGISLIRVGITDLGGGAKAANFGAPINLALGGMVLVVIIGLNLSRRPWVRLSAVMIGLLVGSLVAWSCGLLKPQALPDLPLISVPLPFRFGFAFDWSAFLPVALIYLISTLETTGDLTANCLISRQPIEGPGYLRRLRGGVLGDGVACLLAATFNTFPSTTFAQNNGVIQLTGVASRHVGCWIGAILLVLGLFPILGAVLQQIPKPVLGGATLVLFGSVAAAGIRLLAQCTLDRRSLLIIATSLGVGLGVASQPTLLDQLPPLVKSLFDTAITSGGITAILLNLLLPEERSAALTECRSPAPHP